MERYLFAKTVALGVCVWGGGVGGGVGGEDKICQKSFRK